MIEEVTHLQAHFLENKVFHSLLDAQVTNAKSLNKLFINKVKIHYDNAHDAFENDKLQFVDVKKVDIDLEKPDIENYFQK